MKPQPITLTQPTPEVAAVITKLSEFAATYAELTSEFNSYINSNQHMFIGDTIECGQHLEIFNDSSREVITYILFFVENVICSTHLKSN